MGSPGLFRKASFNAWRSTRAGAPVTYTCEGEAARRLRGTFFREDQATDSFHDEACGSIYTFEIPASERRNHRMDSTGRSLMKSIAKCSSIFSLSLGRSLKLRTEYEVISRLPCSL